MILLVELSNPSLASRWFLLNFDQGSTMLFKVVETSFIGLFLAVRIGLAYLWMTPIIIQDLVPIAMGASIDSSRFPGYTNQSYNVVQNMAIAALGLLIFFHSINAFFLYKIVNMGMKKKTVQPEEMEWKTASTDANDTKQKIIASNLDR
jgi:hypothetical protein